MDSLSILFVLGFLAFFAFIVYMAINSGRADSENKRQLAQALGFTPLEPDEHLNLKVSELYRSGTRGKEFQLKHVSRKVMPDGELYLLDVIETSGEDDSISDQQAVVIISSRLNLPCFVMYPKVDADKYPIGGLANKLIRWVTNFIGKPVDFPEYHDFEKKYIISSADPEPVRRYFDSTLAQALARTSLYHIYAGGDAFAFSQLDTQFKKPDQHILGEFVNQALDLLRILSK